MAILIPGHQHIEAEGKLVRHQAFAPTRRQYEEGKKYQAAGGLCVLIGWSPIDKKMYISEWTEQAKKETSFHNDEGNYADQLEEWLRQLGEQARSARSRLARS